MTVHDLRLLTEFPDLVTCITAAAELSPREVTIDLKPGFSEDNPYALVELVLLARTLGVRLILSPPEKRETYR